MSNIYEMIQEFCPDGVKWEQLGEICVSLKKGTLKQGDLISDGAYPVINSGREWYGFYNSYNNEADAFVIAARGEYAGFVSYISTKFWAGGLCYPYRSINEDVMLTKFFYYYLKNIEQSFMDVLVARGSIPAINKSDVDKILIPIPPLPIQEEIVRILDKFTALEAELEAELEARKKQYEYYRNQLLSPIEKDGKWYMNGKEVELKTFGDMYKFQYGTGNTIPTIGGKYPVYGSNGIVGSHNEYNSEDSPVIGHIGAYAGIVNWATGKHFVTYNGVICKLIIDNVLPRYAYHQLLQQDFLSMAHSGSQPFVSYGMLNKVSIPIPPPSEQERIVSILDRFDALVNDISIGLPAEIEARRKQYEYYRGKLLSFKNIANKQDA
jgi:type I restriction enzyme, S subunit